MSIHSISNRLLLIVIFLNKVDRVVLVINILVAMLLTVVGIEIKKLEIL